MSDLKWIPIKKKPKEEGLYLVCARSADAKMPFRHVAMWFNKEGFVGLVPLWIKAISHWMPFPKTPFKESEK